MFPLACAPRSSFPQEYYLKILNTKTANLIAYWPLWEASGLIADDLKNRTSTVNILVNGSFETPGTGGANVFGTWSESADADGAIEAEVSVVHTAGTAAKITSGAAKTSRIIQNPIVVVPGEAMTFAFWTRGDGTNAGRYYIYDVTHSAVIKALGGTGISGTDYTAVSYSFTIPAGCTAIRIDFWGPDASGGIAYFDDATFTTTRYLDGAISPSGITYGETGIGDGKTALKFSGTNTYVDIGTSKAFQEHWNGNKGSAIAWCKVAAASNWIGDTVNRYPFHPKSSNDDTVYIAFGKLYSSDHTLTWMRRVQNVKYEYTHAFSPTGPTAWICMGMIWDLESTPKRIACYLYANGIWQKLADVEPATGNETWDKAAYPVDSDDNILFAGAPTLQNWIGWGAHVVYWDAVLTDQEMQQVMTL